MNEQIRQNRRSMHCPHFKESMRESDQSKGIPHPPHSHPVRGELIELPAFDALANNAAYTDLLDTRRSVRAFTDKAITGAELAFLLWSAQGIQSYRGANQVATLRPVPSGGARHPFELYVAVQNVEGLNPGLYRYVPLAHMGEKRAAVEYLGGFEDYETRIPALLAGQTWAGTAPLVLFFSAVPYRAEWRYQEASHRVMLIDLGHVGQNVMLSAEALGLGSCCCAAYDQALCDAALGFDGEQEYTVYAVPVGTPG